MATSAGLVSVETGSLVVSGSLTSFVAAEGDQLIVRGLTALIARQESSSRIVLKRPWSGPTISGADDWDISLTGPYWNSTSATNKRLSDLLNKFEAGPFKWDAAGLPSERANYNDQGTGFTFLAVGDPWVLYTKLANTGASSDWSPGQAITGSEAASTAEAKAAAGAAQGSASAASSAADAAAGAASTAAGQASSASGSASSAAGSASSAAGSASNAAGSASTAQGAATTATTQATTATTAAGTATTQAGIASTAAGTATTQAGIATTQAQNAVSTLAATNDVRYAVALSDGAAFQLADDAGNVGLQFTGAAGLQTFLAQITSLVATQVAASQVAASQVAAGQLALTGGHVLAPNPAFDSYDIADEIGNVVARFDANGLTVAKLTAAALALNGALSAGSLDLTAGTLSTISDPNVAFAIVDPAGWIAAILRPDGTLQVNALQTASVNTGADYSADYIAERNARAVALSAGYRGLLDTTSAAAVWAYTHAIVYGQSLGAGQEAWPAKTLTGRSDVLMIGQSVRPGGSVFSTAPSPAGDSSLRAAVATVQKQTDGTFYNAAGQAALPVGDNAVGEEPGLAAMLFARRLFLQRHGVQAADDRRFVVTNCCVPGTAIEELSKGATTEYFNRLRTMSAAVKNAAVAAGGSYGVAALFWFHGEYNYSGTNGGSTDKATYKTNLKKIYADVIADVCTGIAGQSEPPAIITYQTGGQYTVDATDLSIGMAQWELSQETASWYLAAPAYPVTDKGGHLDPNGSRWLGLQMGKVFHETVVLRRRWKPLSPIQATVRGKTVLVDFHLPSGTPLQFQPVYVGQVGTTFADKGFTVIDDSGVIPLTSVILAGDAVVQISLGRAPVGTVNLYYGRRTTFSGGGNLCDSDPTVAPFNYEYAAGSGDYAAANIPALVGSPYPLWNWCIAFKMTAVAN